MQTEDDLPPRRGRSSFGALGSQVEKMMGTDRRNSGSGVGQFNFGAKSDRSPTTSLFPTQPITRGPLFGHAADNAMVQRQKPEQKPKIFRTTSTVFPDSADPRQAQQTRENDRHLAQEALNNQRGKVKPPQQAKQTQARPERGSGPRGRGQAKKDDADLFGDKVPNLRPV